MAKQRLVDFRGGINEKVSPHMIGDSQGQNAVDIDFSTVRLEGRNTIDTTNSASGSFLYDPGDGVTDPRFVSIYPTDTTGTPSPYIEYSSDFAVWNRDLYVAKGAPVKHDSSGNLVAVASSDHTGQTVRFLDGATTAQTLSFNAPSAVTATLSDANYTTIIVPALDEIPAAAGSGQTGIVTTGATNTSNYSVINYQLIPTYSQYGTEQVAAGGRTIYRKSGATTDYYIGGTGSSSFTGEVSGYFYTRSNDSIQSSTIGVHTSNMSTFSMTSTGGVDTGRNFVQGNAHGVTQNGVQFYSYSSSLGSNLYGQAYSIANSPIVTGTPSQTFVGVNFGPGAVTTSNYTQLNGTSLTYSFNSSNWRDSDFRTGTSTQYFNRYSGSNGTIYYAPQNSTTINGVALTANNFYTQSGGGTSSQPQSEYVRLRWDRNTIASLPYSSFNTHQRYVQKWTSGALNLFVSRTQGTYPYGTIYISTNYGSASGRAGVWLGTTSLQYFQCWANGKFFAMQSNGDLQQYNLSTGSVIANTYMSNADVLNIVWFRCRGLSGNNGGFSTNTLNFYITNVSNTATYYDFLEQDDGLGTAKWYSSGGTLLFTQTNLTSGMYNDTVGYTDSSGWKYTIPNWQTVTPSTVEPTGVPNRNWDRVTQMYEYASGETRNKTITVNVDYTYSAHTRSESQTSYWTYPTQQATATRYSFPSNMTYSVWSDTIPAGTVIPATDAFTYDDARTKIYQRNTSSGTPTVINDESRGNNWLGQGRAFSGADAASAYGYFLKTVRGSNNLPTLSNAEIRATPSGTDVMTGDALHTPQRINFTITDPTDQSGAPDAYRLYRKDNGGTVDLGYIKPSRLNSTAYSTDISFSFNSTNKTVTISNLLTASKYRIKWWAYQQSRVSSITVGSGSANTAIAAKSNTTGFSFDGSSSIVIQLATSPSGDVRMFACDFWLEESVLPGPDAASLLDDTFAVIKCYDVLHDTAYDQLDADNDGTPDDVAQTIQGTSDFLDLFAANLLNDGLGSSSAVSAPDYCKFFKESNNFFFAVGTSFTTNTLYGGSGNTNKKGSYLFVSEYNDPTTWYASGYVQFDSEITGLHTYPGEMIVWTENGTYRVTGSRYDQMRKTKLATTEGMPEGQHRTAVLVNNYLVWMSQSGICVYDGRGVANLTRGRFNDFGFTDAQKRHAKYDLSDAVGTALHAGQYEGIYYLVGSDEAGFAVDFNLEGFPVSRVDLKEGAAENTTTPPVLFYNPRENQLLSRRGRIAEGSGNNTWTYKTREFDGGAFGSLKLVKSVVVNGSGSGKIQVYLDGQPAFLDNAFKFDLAGQTYLIKSVPDQLLQTQFEFYYNGTVIRSKGGSYVPDTANNESGDIAEGATWSIDAGVAPDANGPAWNVTFESTPSHTDTHSTGSGNTAINWTNTYYAVKNNLLVNVPLDVSIDYSPNNSTQPARIYVPASPTNNTYKVPIVDVWSIEVIDWNGKIDWIDTEYEMVST